MRYRTFIIRFFVIIAIFYPHFRAMAIDHSKYITTDEIKTNMQAYCLTVYKGTKIEKFPLEILSVVKNYDPGRDFIFVMGVDDRFKHTGAVAGCSGSPVFIDNRLAGALSMGWSLGKDPLYGVTPIEEMLRAGFTDKPTKTGGFGGNIIDVSKPLNFAEINTNFIKAMDKKQTETVGDYKYLAVPLSVSLPQRTIKYANDYFQAAGFMPVSAPSGSSAGLDVPKDFQRGSVLGVSLVTGDIQISGIGTVTEVVDDKVYGFGHSMLGRGSVELPISNGYIHTIVSSIMTSFKLGQAGDVIGTLTNDISTAVYGKTGKYPTLMPLNIQINRFNDIPRTYNCQAAKDKYLTPLISAYTIVGAIMMIDELPDDFVISSKTKIDIEGFEPLISSQTISNSSPYEIAANIAAPLIAATNNPFKQLNINSIDFQASIENKSIISTIEDITIPKSILQPSETLDITVHTREYKGIRQNFIIPLTIPADIQPGQYIINISGGGDYAKFVVQSKPHLYAAFDIESLMSAIKNTMAFDNQGLYAVMPLPPNGIVIERNELSDLPFTKAVPLSDSKRTIQVKPNSNWIETKQDIKRIFTNSKQISITIER